MSQVANLVMFFFFYSCIALVAKTCSSRSALNLMGLNEGFNFIQDTGNNPILKICYDEHVS